jgi:hypothetical protein
MCKDEVVGLLAIAYYFICAKFVPRDDKRGSYKPISGGVNLAM